MRWIWIDRFIEFEKGSHAKALKNVTLAEEYLHDHFPGFPVLPASLMIEGMAQTGGILLGETCGWKKIVILAKLPKASFYKTVRPGDTVVYSARLLDARDEGGSVDCQAHVGGQLVAETQIVFVHADYSDSHVGAIDQKAFVSEMRVLAGFESPAGAQPKAPRSPENHRLSGE